jgi:biotin carboxyl carrier protein
MLFIFASLYFIKLPIHIKAIGEVLAGKDYHQLIINEDNKVVSNIATTAGDSVVKGQVLLQLDAADEVAVQGELSDINIQTQALNTQLTSLEEHYNSTLENIVQQRQEQKIVVDQLFAQLVSEKNILARYSKNVANGLVAATLKDTQIRIVAATRSSLSREKSLFTKLDLATLDASEHYNREKDRVTSSIARLALQAEQLTKGHQVISPCDCTVDNMLVENGIPIIPGQSIMTLSQARESSSLVLFVPASQYRQIDKGSQIQVKVASYPSNKYGALIATVQNVSASPVPGNMISKKGQRLNNATYFIVNALIEKVPSDVTLVTGMAIDSDIVVDKTSLFTLMFNLNR